MNKHPFGGFWRIAEPIQSGTVWVLGAGGQLGRLFLKDWPDSDRIRGFPRETWDITRPDHLEQHLYRIPASDRPVVIINCAAYTQVDQCEVHPDRAMAVNAHGVGLLAHACERLGIFLVHISSDYVFDGRKTEPYEETDAPHPVNEYGRSKLEGEREVLRQMPSGRYLIIRTSWVFSPYGRNFVTWAIDQLTQGRTIRCVEDQIGAPTIARDLVQVVVRLLREGYGGWFHFRNGPAVSRYEQGRTIAGSLNVPLERVERVQRADMNWVAPRPPYSVLDVSRVTRILGVEPGPWIEGLHEVLRHTKV